MKASNPKRERAAVDRWNAANKVGAIVDVRKDSGAVLRTKTRTEAWVMGGHTAVVMVEGIRGVYLLDRCTAVTGAAP